MCDFHSSFILFPFISDFISRTSDSVEAPFPSLSGSMGWGVVHLCLGNESSGSGSSSYVQMRRQPELLWFQHCLSGKGGNIRYPSIGAGLSCAVGCGS